LLLTAGLWGFSHQAQAEPVRVGVLKFGTVAWELEVIKHHGLDRKAGFELEVVPFASTQATKVGLQAGALDVIVSDWFWVSRQRAAGADYTFAPYSRMVGALLAAGDAPIRNLADLKGKRLEAIIDLAVGLGAERLEVAHVQYYGWGLKNRAALIPTRAQLERATEVVEAAIERLKGVLVFDYVVPDYYAHRPKACMGGWGRQFLNITPSGKVLPCHAAETIPGLEFERVTERGLAEIWENSPAFQRFRGTEWMPEPCASCERREIDWGGCRCQALAITGDAAQTDPACSLSPRHAELVALAEAESEREPPAFEYRRMTRKEPIKA
jgi:radical SAM protein with 4Fe4S-binding SPASM domain